MKNNDSTECKICCLVLAACAVVLAFRNQSQKSELSETAKGISRIESHLFAGLPDDSRNDTSDMPMRLRAVEDRIIRDCGPSGKVNKHGNYPYTQGSLDAERRMQTDAVELGHAHWEGELNEFFVWNGHAQRFPRIQD